MSSISFNQLAKRFPDEAETIRRLAKLVTSPGSVGKVYTLDRLADLLETNSREDLALILAELVRAGVLRLFVRVESPSSRGGIGDFDDIDKIPDTIHDWRTDRELQVTPEDLRVLYALRETHA